MVDSARSMVGPFRRRMHVRRAGRLVLFGLAILIPMLAVAAACPYETRAAVAVVGRQRNGCTLGGALAAVGYTARHRRLVDRLREQSRVLETAANRVSLWETPRGRYWAPDEDAGHFFVLAELQLEPHTPAGIVVAKGDVVLECGAYLGHFTSAALTAGASRVIALEPGTRQVECLRRTFAAEVADGRVSLVSEGVWSAEGRLMFQDVAAPGAGYLEAGVAPAPGGGPVVPVPVTTIDALVERLRLDRVDMIKMDIEGSEQEALAGAARTLGRFRPKLVIAAYHKSSDPDRIPAIVRAANPSYRFASAGCRLAFDEIRPLTFLFY